MTKKPGNSVQNDMKRCPEWYKSASWVAMWCAGWIPLFVQRGLCLLEGREGVVDGQAVFYAEVAAAAAHEGAEVGAAAESFAEVPCESTDICAFAAFYAYFSQRKMQGGSVGDVNLEIPDGQFPCIAR